MNTYTIDSETYIVYDQSLFKIVDVVDSIHELEENTYYLTQDTVGVFELQSESIPYSSFDAVFTSIKNDSITKYYTETTDKGDSFTSVKQLKRVVPDQLEECPNCGAAAGKKSDENTPNCFECGYTTPKASST